jgi:hypothetical protein
MTVHSCPNNVIIVNLDGDDQFAHDKVLQRINEAYQDDNVWMTYGQYLEWPNKQWPKGKLGICRKIPNVIHAQQAYRYYDWVTSHPRTFYAGLFKAIPLGYFLHNGQFQPSAVDFAMMYSMLELSKGRVHFIDEILYYYNCENPNNLFRTMILTDMAMGYISRGREPLEPLTYDPRRPEVGNTNNASLAIVCLCDTDKEKTQKLCTSLLHSSLTKHDIYLLYKTYINAFEQLNNQLQANNRLCETIDITKQPITESLLQICATQHYTHILLLTDDYIIVDGKNINIPDMIRLIEKTHAIGFYIALAKEYTSTKYPTIEQPLLVECEPNVYAWKFNKTSGPWRFAYTTDCALYPITDLCKHIQGIPCTTKQELRELLHSYAATRTEDVGICYTHALCRYA